MATLGREKVITVDEEVRSTYPDIEDIIDVFFTRFCILLLLLTRNIRNCMMLVKFLLFGPILMILLSIVHLMRKAR